MTIQSAKSIPLDEFLKKLGFVPVRERNGELWYCSPFRNENTPSFKLTRDRMAFFDHGVGEGGNIIDLAFKLNRSEVVSEALSYISNVVGLGYTIPTIRQPLPVQTSPAYKLIAATEFQINRGRGLSQAAAYLQSRGLDPVIMRPYLRDVVFCHETKPDKKLFGFGLPNNKGGFEIRQMFHGGWMKSIVGNKAFTHFPANKEIAPWFSFEGMPDFGTFLSIEKPAPGTYHYLILNGAGMTDQAIEHLKEQPKASLIQCPQKGGAGDISKEKLFNFVNENGWTGGDIEYRYEGFDDYNEWLMADRKLTGNMIQPGQSKPGYNPTFKP